MFIISKIRRLLFQNGKILIIWHNYFKLSCNLIFFFFKISKNESKHFLGLYENLEERKNTMKNGLMFDFIVKNVKEVKISFFFLNYKSQNYLIFI